MPFGHVHVSTGANIDLRFPGQWFQSESGLFQNWMRDYDPTLGRYIQGDPLGLIDGPSVYGYAVQNPGRYSDFMGHDTRYDPNMPHTTTGSGVLPHIAIGGGGLGVQSIGGPSGFGTEIDTRMPIGTPITQSGHEGGRASGQSPYDKISENAAINFALSPFGGDDYCRRLKQHIRVLEANLAWRRIDLNPISDASPGHRRRIKTIENKLRKMKQNYRNVCGECPTT